MDAHAPKFPVVAKSVAFAFKALNAGKANEAQQKLIIEYVAEACGLRRPSFRFGDSHATAFAEGMRFAGLIIVGAAMATPVTPPTARGKSRHEAKPE